MRIAIGVDWSDQAFTAVTQTFHAYHPSDVTLVHGVDLGMFEYPIVAEAANLQGYDDFRNAMVDAGRQLVDRAAAMIPDDVGNVRRINEIGSPAQVILNVAKTVAADLIVVGARGRSRVSELVLGSVSHRVLSHAP
ncbi:MAG TPA: universal stress protein, partial [Nitrospiraceae bacterium]